jgi:general secretion pathway protein G
LGILGLTCFWLFTAIPAVICGHVAYSRVRRSAGALSGEGLALAGLITGYISIALSIFVIPMLAAIAIPNFVKARTTAQTNACINNLRQIDGAIQQWALDNKKTDDAHVTFNDISPYLKTTLICPAGGTTFSDSYSITTVGQRPTCLKVPDKHKLEAARE